MARTSWIDAFDQVRVISLIHRTDRRAALEAEFVECFGRELGDIATYFDATIPTERGNFHSAGERGCFESHQAVLSKAAADGVQRLLLLEDDAFLRRDELAAMNAATERLLERGDDTWHMATYGSLDVVGHLEAAGSPPDGYWVPLAGRVRRSHCLAFTAEGIARALAHLDRLAAGEYDDRTNGPMAVDGAYNVLTMADDSFMRLAASPPIIPQRSGRSDISPSWVDRYATPLRPVIDKLQGLLGRSAN